MKHRGLLCALVLFVGCRSRGACSRDPRPAPPASLAPDDATLHARGQVWWYDDRGHASFCPYYGRVDCLYTPTIISVSPRAVLLDGVRVARTETLAPGRRIDALYDELVRQRREHPLLHPGEPFPGLVYYQLDPAVTAEQLRVVHQTCVEAGYDVPVCDRRGPASERCWQLPNAR